MRPKGARRDLALGFETEMFAYLPETRRDFYGSRNGIETETSRPQAETTSRSVLRVRQLTYARCYFP